MTTELWSWTASELADAIREGKVSSVEATGSALARMEAANGPINAVVDALPEGPLVAWLERQLVGVEVRGDAVVSLGHRWPQASSARSAKG